MKKKFIRDLKRKKEEKNKSHNNIINKYQEIQ